MDYSNKFKEAILKKYFSSDSPNANALARNGGIPTSTLWTWIRKRRRFDMTDNNGSSKKLTPQQKLDFVLQASRLTETELGEFLRKNGLYSSQLELWKKEMIDGLQSSSQIGRASCRERV